MPRSVLIPVDGSENSQRAFDFYVSDLRRADDVVLLCHIQNTPSLSTVSLQTPLELPIEEWKHQIQEELLKSQKVVNHYEAACEKAKIQKKLLVGRGKPGEEICVKAIENHASMIVMGSRGLNGVRRTFIGSVSDYIIHHAHIPVVVVPPQ